MAHSADYNSTLSIKLSEVMEDIGVNENMVMRKRRLHMLMENIHTVSFRAIGLNATEYILGSQSEGTSFSALKSDVDVLNVMCNFNVMQDWSEWEQNKLNYLMIQDENVTQGYCFLQLIRLDVPLPALYIPDERHIRDIKGRILLTNNWLTGIREGTERHGPSNAKSTAEDFNDKHYVTAFPCKSWPQSDLAFLERKGTDRWPSSEMIRYAARNGCFVVGTGSKISTYPDLEWRISTSLAERCLMFNLNLTQLHCYVLMKIILKEFLNPQKQNVLSSYMCKTILFHCIESSERGIWKRQKLSSCLVFCLLKLHSFILNGKCPHFMISRNNLMAGQFCPKIKNDILIKLSDFIQSDDRYLLRLDIGHIGHRLQVKLNTSIHKDFKVPTARESYENCVSLLYINLANLISNSQLPLYLQCQNNRIDHLKTIIYNLIKYSVNGHKLEQLASRFILPFLYSALGSSLISYHIGQISPISTQALSWLSFGLNSDVTSGRLKLASVFLCTGDISKAEFILNETERLYRSGYILLICGCHTYDRYSPPAELKMKCCEENEECLRHMTSFCIRFSPTELNCCPRELQYEMNRSTLDDVLNMSHTEKDCMQFAVIDSPSYLFFLQYKTYGQLQKYQDQQRALNNLMVTTVNGVNLGHRETAFNLLGQCMEQEGKPRAALQFYISSHKQRAGNNAVKFHICNLLAKIGRHT